MEAVAGKKEAGEEFTRLNQHVTGAGFQLLKGPGGLLLVPATSGKPLSEPELERVGWERRASLESAIFEETYGNMDARPDRG